MTQHLELAIVRGIPRISDDTNSPEIGVDELSLLNTQGFSLKPNGWIPRFPQVRGGGEWVDGQNHDTLLRANMGRIVETFSLTATAASWLNRFYLESRLFQVAQNARGLHIDDEEIQPVYLKWKPLGATKTQYALIYSIDIVPNLDPYTLGNINEITITITRAAYWLPLAPGKSPKEFTYELLGLTYNTASASLIAGTYLTTAALKNCVEWSTVSVTSDKNYIDIPAASIPGDAPALAHIQVVQGSTHPHATYLIARTTIPLTRDRSGGTVQPLLDLTAAIGLTSIDTTLATDTGGCLYTPRSVNRRRAEVSFATVATDTIRMSWPSDDTSIPPTHANNMRGRYMAFIRARQHNGTFGDIKMSLALSIGGLFRYYTTPEQSPTVQTGTGNTTSWPLTYMGVIEIPPGHKTLPSLDGRGLFSTGPASTPIDLFVTLRARRTAGVGVLYICDVILIPIDEAVIQISNTLDTTFYGVLYDNTGYMAHGLQGGSAYAFDGGAVATSPPSVTTLQGGEFTLQPREDNRIYVLLLETGDTSQTQTTFNVNVHVMPRWAGIRDL